MYYGIFLVILVRLYLYRVNYSDEYLISKTTIAEKMDLSRAYAQYFLFFE